MNYKERIAEQHRIGRQIKEVADREDYEKELIETAKNEFKQKKKKIMTNTVIRFIIANIYIVLAAIFWDTSRVANALIEFNVLLIFAPAACETIFGLILYVGTSFDDIVKEEDTEQTKK